MISDEQILYYVIIIMKKLEAMGKVIWLKIKGKKSVN